MTMDPIVERAKKGDAQAFHELFLANRDQVSRLVFRMLGPSPDVDDVVQDVFVHVYRSLPKFRGDSKFSTWLYRLTTNVTRMHLRRGRSRPRFADVPMPETSPTREPSATPDLTAERNRRVNALYRLLSGLSEKKRTVLILHDLEGISPKEISERVDAPIMTVRTRLFYARKELYAAIASDPTLAHSVEALLPNLPGRPKGEKESKTRQRKISQGAP
ncbi:MAG: sigma-70 family RNA polymerase sigma factor [Myxococcota bacterium]